MFFESGEKKEKKKKKWEREKKKIERKFKLILMTNNHQLQQNINQSWGSQKLKSKNLREVDAFAITTLLREIWFQNLHQVSLTPYS